jgi:3-hydroxy-3-methylglutaryl CoA synthase
MFSFGSGCASSMFVLKITKDITFMKNKINLQERVQNRIKISASEYD